MLTSWERILYFHVQPAILDGMFSLLGVLLLLRIFRVRNSSVRSLFLFVPLVRPLLILLEGAADLERVSPPNAIVGLRVTDPFNLIPTDLAQHQKLTDFSSLIAWTVTVTLVAAVIFLIYRWAGFVLFYRRLHRRSSLAPVDGNSRFELQKLVKDLSARIGLKQPPEIIYCSGDWLTPCAIGWRHPALVIDPELPRELKPEELRAVLAHELSHIRRGDGLWHWISVLLRDVQSFSPFSHLSIARIGLEREKACDREAVQTLDIPPRLMAECLVKVARLAISRQARPLPGYGMSLVRKPRALEDRVKYLLGIKYDNKGKEGKGRARSAGVKAALLAAWVPLVLLQVYICVWIGGFPLVIK